VTFGLVNVPIKLYTATESQSVSFHEVHARDGARIEHRRICAKEDREVPYEEVVKGYEISEGKYVVLEDDEVKAAAGDRGKVVALDEFVDASAIDPVFHDREYLVALRAHDDVLALHTLRFADEVVDPGDLEIDAPGRKPARKEVEMARKLIDSLHEDFDPAAYADTYRDAVLDLIRRKAKGEDIDLDAQEEPEHGDDLAAALEASLGS